MICLYCNADNDSKNVNCFSCKAPLPKRLDLSDENYEKYKKLIIDTEAKLEKSANKGDKIGLILIVLTIVASLSASYLLYVHSEYKILVVVLVVLMHYVLYNFIGIFPVYFNTQEATKAFNNIYKKEILHFLKKSNLRLTDFKIVASMELSIDSCLIQYIDDLWIDETNITKT